MQCLKKMVYNIKSPEQSKSFFLLFCFFEGERGGREVGEAVKVLFRKKATSPKGPKLRKTQKMIRASVLSEVLGLQSGCSEYRRQAQEQREQNKPFLREHACRERSEKFSFSLFQILEQSTGKFMTKLNNEKYWLKLQKLVFSTRVLQQKACFVDFKKISL